MNRAEGISVIVCCYNSAERISPTLEHLFQQVVLPAINWEIIIVNNNSTDSTSEKVQKLYEKSGSSIPFKVVFESNPGLSNARQAGFNAGKYEIALMVDDDNWLSSNYLSGVWKAFQSDSEIGMVGGLGIPVLEAKAPNWFGRYAYCYATGAQTEDGKRGFAKELYGAGLALRLSVLDKLKECGFESLLSDRIGNSLISGGDIELSHAFRMAGFKLLYDPDITFEHELPKNRVNWRYLRRLFHGFGLTKPRLDMYGSSIKGYDLPTDGRFPFWFNRSFFLFKKLIPDIPLLIWAKLALVEGNDRLLAATGKLGQLKAILAMRKDYVRLYEKVHRLRIKLEK